MALFEANNHETIEAAPQGGAPDALLQLGLQYCSGRDVPLDMIEAHKWFNLAAMRGSDAARRYRQEIATELSRTELGLAQRRAREWLSTH